MYMYWMNHAPVTIAFIIANMSFNVIRENKTLAKISEFTAMHTQWRTKNAEKVTHIKGRLLEQIFSSIASLFKMGTSLKGKNSFPEEANSFL